MALVTRGNNMRLLRGGKVRALIMPGRPRNVNDAASLDAAVRSLFAAGEQGAWYDPSDFSTMFQDSAGKTPVTAIGQPVGLLLDKSKGLALGPQLVANGDFSSDTTGWTPSVSTLAAVNGELVSTGNVGASYPGARYSFTTVVGTWYKVTGQFRRGTSSNTACVVIKAPSNITSIIVNSTTTTAAFSIFFLAPTTTATIDCFENGVSDGGTVIFDNISAQSLSGNHASQSTTTSMPILRQDESGRYYLEFDGTDDWLQTGNIDFSATDKMSVFAGVRKLSDTTRGVICDLSQDPATTNATFSLMTAGSTVAGAKYGAILRGTDSVMADTPATFIAPVTNVLTEINDIAGANNADELILRVNSVPVNLTFIGSNARTGNFGSYPLYIGRRGGTTLPFNGRIYSLLIRGELTSSPQLEQIEAYVASKTGVTL